VFVLLNYLLLSIGFAELFKGDGMIQQLLAGEI
jgi:hypothetical protein